MNDAAIEVTGIRIRPLRVPLPRPLTVAFGVFSEGPFLAVELYTRAGATGRVLAFTFHRLGLTVVPPLLLALTEFAKGRPLTYADAPAFHDACQKHLQLLGHEGVAQLALSIFDMALHDALAIAAGVPLYALLGGSAIDIPAYNSCGGSLVPAPDAAIEARDLAAEHDGFAHVKVRLGRPHFADDLAALHAIRAAVPPRVQLSIDFNQALPVDIALERCRAIDALGLTWIEEPVVYDDLETQAALTAALHTPVQVGENWWHWRVAERALAMRACDFAMPDVLRIGGVTGWLRTAQAAARHAVPLSSHLSPEYSAHLLAASPTRHWLEYMDWAQDLLLEPLVPRRGIVRPTERPGAGIAFDEHALQRRVVGAASEC